MNELISTDRHALLWLCAPWIFVLVEMGVSFQHRLGYYRWENTFASLGCGLLRLLLRIVSLPLFFSLYETLYLKRLWDFSSRPFAAWAVGFGLYTFLAYWLHRLYHQVPSLWALHKVHHQSEDFNALQPLQDSPIADLLNLSLVLTLAVAGIPSSVMAPLFALIAAQATLLHTQLLGDYGWLGKIITAPSHHRVHHGINPIYLDRNFGISTILWDKIFKTYQSEQEPPVYGTVVRFTSHNPFLANLAPWFDRSPQPPRVFSVLSKPPSDPRQRRYSIFQLACAFVVLAQPFDLRDVIAPQLYAAIVAWAILQLLYALSISASSRWTVFLGMATLALGVGLLTRFPWPGGIGLTIIAVGSGTLGILAFALSSESLQRLREKAAACPVPGHSASSR